MKDITSNEIKALLIIFKDIKNKYNANNLSKILGITPMGTLKILKGLEKDNIISPEKLGKATFYKINFKSHYAKSYLRFFLEKEAQHSLPRVKAKLEDLKNLSSCAEIGILFGSILKSENFNDIDVLLVLKNNQVKKCNKITEEIEKISSKTVHIIKQTPEDLRQNLQKNDKVVLEIIKTGIVIFGQDKIIEVIENVSN